jgi:prefoldin subunit 5
MSSKALQMLQKRREEILAIIQPLEHELVDIDNAIAKIDGKTTLDQVYDDETHDYIRNTEDGI